MKVHPRQIPADGLHLEGKEDKDILELADEGIRPAGPVVYSLDLGVSESSLFATGRIAVDIDVECVSCLTRFIYPLVVEDFAFQVELTGPEQVDLTPWVREDILLVLPAHPHCDWDGKTVCKGPRLKPSPVEEPPAASVAWNVLDELKLKLKN
jgi:uncharacterized metal-binding protein YceD (DUF177 family)